MTRNLTQELRLKRELLLRVKVVPGSSRTEIAGFLADGTLKVRVQAPPEKGKANAGLCALLAEELNVHPRKVEIVAGRSSPLKQVRIRL